MLDFAHLWELRMFNDLFHVVHSLEHDFQEEKGEQVHSYACRRCALSVRLSTFKTQIQHLLHDIDAVVGDPIEKNQQS